MFKIIYEVGGVVPPLPAVVPVEPEEPVLPDIPVEPVLPVVPCADVESTLTESVEVAEVESVAADAVFDLHDDSAMPAQIHIANANFFILVVVLFLLITMELRGCLEKFEIGAGGWSGCGVGLRRVWRAFRLPLIAAAGLLLLS